MSQTDSIAYVPILFWFLIIILWLYWVMFIYLIYNVVVAYRIRFYSFYYRLWKCMLSVGLFFNVSSTNTSAVNLKKTMAGGKKKFFFTIWLRLYRSIFKFSRRRTNFQIIKLLIYKAMKFFVQTRCKLFSI